MSEEEAERNGKHHVADAVEAGSCCLVELLAGFTVLLGMLIVPALLLR